METILTKEESERLAIVFRRGADSASSALSRWLGKTARLTVSAVEPIALEEASELLGPGDSLVAACSMPLLGALSGELILAFGDRSGLALADILLNRATGTATEWGELERSAAMETANIVGCAYLNALSASLPTSTDQSDTSRLHPGPPHFRHEFAASLLEFALMDQAIVSDHVLLIRTTFSADESELDWSLLFVPGGDSLAAIRSFFAGSEIEAQPLSEPNP